MINYIDSTEILESWLYGEADDSPAYNFSAEGEFSIIALRDEEEWAEVYRGSLRLTGRRAAEPVYQANGDVAPGWRYIGPVSETEFGEMVEAEERLHFGS